jgi:hypothetical protein
VVAANVNIVRRIFARSITDATGHVYIQSTLKPCETT